MSDAFKVLSDREHALLRCGMYLGSDSLEPMSGIIDYQYQTKHVVPALIKMVEEVVQNSIDESIRTNFKFAKNISLDIQNHLSGTTITVQDDGRGIPQDEIDGKARPLLAWTELRAGSNFDDSTRVGVGANGVGSSLVNIFSSKFTGTTWNNGSVYTVVCSNNMENIKGFKGVFPDATAHGTKVVFEPDLERFKLQEFDTDHISVIGDRLTNWAIQFPQITFTFCGKKIKIKSIKEIGKNFHEDSITVDEQNIKMVFCTSGASEEFRLLSYVNGISIKNGGTHVDYIMNKIIENIRAAIKKKHKFDVLPNQIRQHLLFASWISGFPAPKFDSQSKERITNSTLEISSLLSGIDFEKIAKQIIGTASIVDPMIAAILFKQEMKEARELEQKKKSARDSRVANHIAATDTNAENKIIFLAEGLSALANFIATRDSKTMGAFPLKGKPLNIHGRRPLEIMKNVELANIMRIIGLELGEPAKNLKYGKIAIFSDRDLDGHAVYCLLLKFFSLWPELFTEGRIHRVMTPLFYCTKGKQSKIFYSVGDYLAEKLDGWKIDRYKGLGSMPEEVYSECINNPVMEKVSDFDPAKLNMAFGEDASLRKEWMLK